ncbi:MAG: transcription antitermination factor NusB [Bacteroidetes bacterium GWF2_42_66]|nr:MAG: transcription antitermination factor NusB [Bacteroidetes bacterium GWA2_42_15]OFY01090.1 MAG: transcription antitermination factor NusB [Bacteroidetes bacterium GWE2_42_39]OFY41933.1 MAG: transcription antitermination factor NusB [Bacteroidetes bacterium GWF2_42_66]HBL77877.1 transcription antitermination factor NusB [Prolixibacteraceae bacterium]HCR91368.1 transcription antitermination factor NusB [Prolixibacteraceae bacterium]
MISRRIIRIKVLQILYAFYTSPDKSINNTEKELFFSLQKTFDLYHYLLALPVEIVKYAESRIELRKNKHFPTAEDLNPNRRFTDNQMIAQLQANEALNKYLGKTKISWVNEPELIQKLHNELVEQDFFKAYMNASEDSYNADRKLVEDFLTYIVLPSEDMDSHLEEQSIYWNDDLDFVISMVLKTIKRFKETSSPELALMPMFKDDEDEKFAKDLYRKAVLNHADNYKIVQEHTVNWEVERIAFMDILILEMAITEFLYFPSIPTKVSLNEYIELSKYYSTEKSRNFINGILDKTLKDLKKEEKILKAGRGLIGE